jgi:hypothetical protein
MMKASKLISLLMEEVLSKGDGEVVFESYAGDMENLKIFLFIHWKLMRMKTILVK